MSASRRRVPSVNGGAPDAVHLPSHSLRPMRRSEMTLRSAYPSTVYLATQVPESSTSAVEESLPFVRGPLLPPVEFELPEVRCSLSFDDVLFTVEESAVVSPVPPLLISSISLEPP